MIEKIPNHCRENKVCTILNSNCFTEQGIYRMFCITCHNNPKFVDVNSLYPYIPKQEEHVLEVAKDTVKYLKDRGLSEGYAQKILYESIDIITRENLTKEK